MGIKRNRKRVIAAAIAVAGVAGGSVAVHAATFSERKLATGAAPVFGSIPMTCTADCSLDLLADRDLAPVEDVNNGNTQVPFFGFGVSHTGDAAAAVSLAGGPTSTIKVPVNTTVTIHFSQDTGDITDPIALSFPSLPRADVDDSVPGVYTIHPTKAGTSVFQPGTNPDAPKQIAMGLVGVLIVTPAGCDSCAYDASTPYDDEAIVATTDLDPEFAADPAAFDMGYFGQSPNPDGSQRAVYHLINGKAFPDTDVIDALAGDSILLRSVNAGVTDKSLGLLGLRQTLLARNSRAYDDPQTFIAPLIGPGETADIVVTVPDTAAVGQMYSLMDQGRQMNHGTAEGFGGALTFINIAEAPAPVVVPPTVDSTLFTAPDQLTINASSTVANITAAEVSTGASAAAAGTGTPVGTTFGSATYSETVTLSPAPASGDTVWVRVQDSNGVWSDAASVLIP